jgi:hypothetical protein
VTHKTYFTYGSHMKCKYGMLIERLLFGRVIILVVSFKAAVKDYRVVQEMWVNICMLKILE